VETGLVRVIKIECVGYRFDVPPCLFSHFMFMKCPIYLSPLAVTILTWLITLLTLPKTTPSEAAMFWNVLEVWLKTSSQRLGKHLNWGRNRETKLSNNNTFYKFSNIPDSKSFWNNNHQQKGFSTRKMIFCQNLLVKFQKLRLSKTYLRKSNAFGQRRKAICTEVNSFKLKISKKCWNKKNLNPTDPSKNKCNSNQKPY